MLYSPAFKTKLNEAWLPLYALQRTLQINDWDNINITNEKMKGEGFLFVTVSWEEIMK